jgi:hypothetical protein
MPPVCFDPEATSERGIPRGFFYATGSERRPIRQTAAQGEEDYVMVSRESVLDLAWGRVGYVGDQGQQKQDGDLLSLSLIRNCSRGRLWPAKRGAGFQLRGCEFARTIVVVESHRSSTTLQPRLISRISTPYCNPFIIISVGVDLTIQ